MKINSGSFREKTRYERNDLKNENNHMSKIARVNKARDQVKFCSTEKEKIKQYYMSLGNNEMYESPGLLADHIFEYIMKSGTCKPIRKKDTIVLYNQLVSDNEFIKAMTYKKNGKLISYWSFHYYVFRARNKIIEAKKYL